MNNFTKENYSKTTNYGIEASAGTGKTYNIVGIVDKILSETDLSIKDLLIVTYTEKAAGELKNRIREVVPNGDISEASIFTIHSFCKNVITEYGLTANLPLNMDVVDDFALSSFADRYIREGEIVQIISSMYQIGTVLNPDNIKEGLIKGVGKYYLDENGNEVPSIISLDGYNDADEAFKTYLKYQKYKDLDEARADDSDLDDALTVIEQKSIKMYESVKKKFNDTKTFEFNKVYICDDENTPGFCKKDPVAEDAARYLTELRKKVTDIAKKISSMIVCKFLPDFYLKWQKEKENNREQTFDDLIRSVRERVMNDDKLVTKLRNKYKYGIIDEFQDTNQKQFDIFKRIFLCDDHHIIVVGDPKQSIYAFQGADVEVYKKAVKDISDSETYKGKKCTLNKNYRSTESVIKACNELFKYYEFGEGIDFEPCDVQIEGRDPKYFDVTFDGKPIKGFWIAEGEEIDIVDPRQYAKIAVQKIIECCSLDDKGNTRLRVKPSNKDAFRNVAFKDFAILCRARSEVPPVLSALRRSGIPYIQYKDKSLFMNKECIDWIAILDAINAVDFTGKNRAKFKKAMFTGFFGYSLEEISKDDFNKDDLEEIGLFTKWRILAKESKWEDMIDDILVSSNLSVNNSSLSEITPFSKYKQIGNFCIEYLSVGNSIEKLIRKLQNLSKGGNDEDSGTLVERSTNFDCVQIMTMHASKGLQFPVVISVGGFKGYKDPNLFEPLIVHRKLDDGKTKQVLSFSGIGDTGKVAKSETMAEWKRLYYVAYTRPQYLLILPNYDRFGADFLGETLRKFMDNNPECYTKITDNHVDFKDLAKSAREILKANDKTGGDTSSKENQDKKIASIIKELPSKETYKHSYSSLSHGEEEEKKEEDDIQNKEGNIMLGLSSFDMNSIPAVCEYDESVEPITIVETFPKGAKIGTALHEVFEVSSFKNYEEHLEGRIKYCFVDSEVMCNHDWIEDTEKIVRNVLNAKLPIIHGGNQVEGTLYLKDIEDEDKKAEVEFNFNLFDEQLKNYCNGFVDLIFRQGEYYSVLDWKSDSLNEEFPNYHSLDSLKKHVDECYSIQRVLYAYCLIKWLKCNYKEMSEEEIFNKHFGGVYYVFLRGCNSDTGNGVYAQTWSSWKKLEDAFNNIVNTKIGGKR